MILNHKFLLLTAFAICLFGTSSCEKDDQDIAPSIASIAVTNADFSTLEGAAIQGGVAVVLSNPNPGDPSGDYTVFAPTDAAFKQLGIDLGVALNIPADIRKLPKETVAAVLLNHVVADGGKFSSEMNGGLIAPLGGVSITLGAFTNGTLTIKGNGNSMPANMVIPDVQTTNGVVHVIDRVLLP